MPIHESDVCVIGGGITGAGVAREAAMRGLRTALVEARDLAWGTSSRSSRLVHGGLRYLEQGALGLVQESLRERRVLLTIAPHLRADAAAATSFVRNVGGSISVAVFQALTVTNAQTVHASLAANIGPEMAEGVLPPMISPETTAGAVALNGEIERQALMVAYVNDFWLLMIIALLSIPLVLLIRAPKKSAQDTGPLPIEAH